MTRHSLYPNAKKATSIDFLSSSQECDYIEYLSYLDADCSMEHMKDLIKKFEEMKINEPQDEIKNMIDVKINEINNDGGKIFEKHIINKLFIDGKKNNKDNSIFFLKNKYLYLYGEGAVYYLQAYNSMHNDKQDLEDLEMKILREFLDSHTKKYELKSLVSLCSANAKKEIKALNDFVLNNSYEGVLKFVPIDVSTPLIQLAILNFNHLFYKNHTVTIHPILGDVWNVAENLQYLDILKDSNPVIFTLFGSTIGNYKESELLNQVIKIMKENDILIMGFDILNETKPTVVNEKNIYDLYNSVGNIQFMLNPLYYIPKYRGYVSSFDKYFKLDKINSVKTSTEKTKEEFNLLTEIDSSICYAPKLEIPSEKNPKMKISLAQSTKYHYKNFETWIKNFKYIPDKECHVHNSIEHMNFELIGKEIDGEKCVWVLKKKVKLKTIKPTIAPSLLKNKNVG